MIRVKHSGETTFLTLIPNEDAQFNLLNTKTLHELIATMELMFDCPSKILRIYGEGDSFAVGADIKTMLTYDGLTAKSFSMLGNKLFKLIQSIPQIVIAEIDGFCMGGGMDFASSCDFRFSTEKSKFAHPGSKLGIITGFGGTQRIPRLIKHRHNTEIFYTGNIFDAKFMKESGFLTEIFKDKTEMSGFVDMFCETISNKNRFFLNLLKSKVIS